jgi:hypothetical protein
MLAMPAIVGFSYRRDTGMRICRAANNDLGNANIRFQSAIEYFDTAHYDTKFNPSHRSHNDAYIFIFLSFSRTPAGPC